jgi:hypothetical protein
MNLYLRNLFGYFEVDHPASGFAENTDKSKLKPRKEKPAQQFSPDSWNLRSAAKKENATRRNPAP